MPSFSSLKLVVAALLLADLLPAPVSGQGSQARPLTLVPATPAEVGMRADLPARVDSLIEAAIADGATPGASVAIGRHGRLVLLRGYGHTDWAKDAVISPPPAVTDSTIYDMASLTKVTATTTAAMILQEEGKLDIDRPVAFYVPELNAPDKRGITVRMLLTHSGGFEAFAKLFAPENGSLRGREEYLKAINERPLAYEPGTKTIYSDWDFVLMQAVIEHITGQTLDDFTHDRVFGPLGMRDTGFRPAASLKARIAPTEIETWRCGDDVCAEGETGGKVWGQVHDENAWALGGVSGHAGLFSSARDMAIFAEMLLNGGQYGTVRLLHPQTISYWTSRKSASSSRALGWDTPSPGSSAGQYFAPRSWGHTGFTGTSVWMDPHKDLFVVLLTNRVDPTRENHKQGPLRRALADLVQESIVDAPLHDWEADVRDGYKR